MKIVIFDTETIGQVSQSLLNVGYQIVDIDTETGAFKPLLQKNYLNSTLYKNKFALINDSFVGLDKKQKYDSLVKSKGIIYNYGIKKILELMQKDLIKYNVVFAYAYNYLFDIDKIVKACQENSINYTFENIPVLDIWAYARKYIIDTKEYLNFAKENNLLTEKGYISTSVESVCKYLYQEENFTEEHTALSDVMHETIILTECVKKGCDITKKLSYKRFFKVEETSEN